MTIKEMRDLPSEELVSEIEKAREKAFRMRFQAKGKDIEHPGQLKVLRRDIARMKTVLNERKPRSGDTRKEAPGAKPAPSKGQGSR